MTKSTESTCFALQRLPYSELSVDVFIPSATFGYLYDQRSQKFTTVDQFSGDRLRFLYSEQDLFVNVPASSSHSVLRLMASWYSIREDIRESHAPDVLLSLVGVSRDRRVIRPLDIDIYPDKVSISSLSQNLNVGEHHKFEMGELKPNRAIDMGLLPTIYGIFSISFFTACITDSPEELHSRFKKLIESTSQ